MGLWSVIGRIFGREETVKLRVEVTGPLPGGIDGWLWQVTVHNNEGRHLGTYIARSQAEANQLMQHLASGNGGL